MCRFTNEHSRTLWPRASESSERERDRVRWGLDWSQSNMRHHYQHQPTNHHHHQPITKILINKKETVSHETLASFKRRTVVNMEGLSYCYWLADRSLWMFLFCLVLSCLLCLFFSCKNEFRLGVYELPCVGYSQRLWYSVSGMEFLVLFRTKKENISPRPLLLIILIILLSVYVNKIIRKE